ncbi:TauD/TfdA family dioxygenase [Gammaproteobacteria bacterium]|nr:TauD/TfdA family dioxygenase [Gammaproteobacteria bacterium]
MTIYLDNLNFTKEFPSIITPKYNISNQVDFIDIIKINKCKIEQILLQYGAILFRGFPVNNSKEFSNFIKVLNLGKFVDYIGGDSPRDKVDDGVYTSTEAPPSFYIPLHQELSFIKHHPRHIYFYCEIPPLIGGETIIADARKVYKDLNSNLIDKFEKKGLTYISRYYYKSRVMSLINRFRRSHKSWIEVFETNDKKDVEKKCKANEFEWRWLKNDWLEIKQHRPAICNHLLTNDTVWFNQAHLYDFNPRLLGLKNYIGASLLYMNKDTKLHEIEFSDGNPIPRKDLYNVFDTLKNNTVAFPWQKRDLLILDNILSMHGRASFNGKRRVLTALTT